MTQKDQKGSMITDMFTINVQARVVVYMYLIFVMTCISPTLIEPSFYQGMHQCWMHVSDTDGRTDRRNTPVPLICLLTDVLNGRKDRHTD